MKISRYYPYNARFIALLLISILPGCDSLVDVDPPGTRPSPELIFQDDLTAVTAVRGMYSEMSSQAYFNNAGISLLSSLSADDMREPFPENITNRQFFEINEITASDPVVKEYFWQPGYRYIYLANSIFEGLAASKGVTAITKNQLRAEALFIRAFSTFYLTNLFGAIPLPTTTDLSTNMHIRRSPSVDAYNAIVADLLEAQQLFSHDKDFSFTRDDFPRGRASYWAATTLLARVYLYLEKWTDAEQQATAVLDQTSLFRLSGSLNGVFLANSEEVIWQLLPVIENTGPFEAQLFLQRANKKPIVYLTESFLTALEPGDQRFVHWVDTAHVGNTDIIYHFPNKYQRPSSQEQFHVELRLAEVYLIRAEARAHQGKLLGAIEDLDMLRSRAKLPSFKGQSFATDALLEKIAQERHIELFAEGGHRWLDLKRTNKASATLSLLDYKKKWEDTDELYPVPESEIINNPNLGPQNRGY
jgi:starch-binding outer membrane protein, SusD/RagB family